MNSSARRERHLVFWMGLSRSIGTAWAASARRARVLRFMAGDGQEGWGRFHSFPDARAFRGKAGFPYGRGFRALGIAHEFPMPGLRVVLARSQKRTGEEHTDSSLLS